MITLCTCNITHVNNIANHVYIFAEDLFFSTKCISFPSTIFQTIHINIINNETQIVKNILNGGFGITIFQRLNLRITHQINVRKYNNKTCKYIQAKVFFKFFVTNLFGK